jgi:hypothetical protein
MAKKRKYKLLTTPITSKDMRGKKWVKGVVPMELSYFIDNSVEEILDGLSELLTGSSLLCDIDYRVVGHLKDELHILVEGCPSMILEGDEL